MNVLVNWIKFFYHTFLNSFLAPYGSTPQQLAAWDCISFITLGFLLVSFFVLLMELGFGLEAPYGKFSNSGLPKFISFLNPIYNYPIPSKIAWFLQELPSFIIPLYFLILSFYNERMIKYNIPFINKFLLCLFIFHYFNRTFIYSFSIRGGKPTGLCAFLLAMIFTSINGYLQSMSLLMYNEYFIKNSFYNLNIIIGCILWLIGFLINKQSDDILRNLRKPGEKGYKIPKNGLFNYVTNAHYFGENLEWFGYSIAINNCAGFAFTFFTFANLFPRALQQHKWYHNKFDDYPKDRKIYIPFIL